MRRGEVSIAPAVRRAIAAHAREAYPVECCGLLLGREARVIGLVRMANVATHPERRYRLDDRAHIALRRMLRDVRPRLAIVGVYHSHPDGSPEPSAIDCAEAHYPEWVHVIAAVRRSRVRLGAFRIRGGRVERLAIG